MNILQMSLSGAVLILAVVVLRTLAMKRLPKDTFLILWGIVLLRLTCRRASQHTIPPYI